MKHLRKATMTLLLLNLILLSGCVRLKPIYFNSDEKIYNVNANQTGTAPFSGVFMSKGKFRELTTVMNDTVVVQNVTEAK